MKSPWGTAKNLKETTMEVEFNHLDHATWATNSGHEDTLSRRLGRDDEVIRTYIRNQELADQGLDQLELKISAAPKSNQS